jgi:hypothetical protein
MSGIHKRLVSGASILSLALLFASPASLWADNAEALSNTEVAAMGHLVVKAAHFTGQNPRLVRYEVTGTKPNRATYILTMEYYGKVTGRRYLATIDIHMDTQGSTMEALRVDYADNNVIPASFSKLARVVHQINNVLGNP